MAPLLGPAQCAVGRPPLGANTSPVSWCEPVGTHSRRVAEWWNTWSNGAFLAAAAWMAMRFRATPRHFRAVVLAMTVVQGLTSGWFHATKSLAGQLADELCIVWLLGLSLGLFSRRLRAAAAASAAYGVVLFVWPRYNHLLLAMSLPCVMGAAELAVGTFCSRAAWRAWRRAAAALAISFLVWSLDKIACSPGGVQLHFHAWWHLCISASIVHIAAAGCVAHDDRCVVRYRLGGLLPETRWRRCAPA